MKKKYTLLVLTNAVAGKDAAFNDWYSNKHLQDVIAVPGFVSAQRFQVVGEPVKADPLYRYCATYDIETDDPQGAIDEMMKRAGTDKMPLSDGLDETMYVTLYEAITPKVSNG
jgi:hypothetical protein